MPRTLPALLAAALLLGSAWTVFGQEAAPDPAAQLKDLSAAQNAVKAGNLELAAEKLSVPSIVEGDIDAWKKALDLRQTALQNLIDILERRDKLPGEQIIREEAERTRLARTALEAEIAENPAKPIPENVTKEILEAAESRLKDLRTEKDAAEKKLADRSTEVDKVRADQSAFNARHAELLAELSGEAPDTSDYLGNYRRRTTEIQLRYRKEWLAHSQNLLGRADQLLATREAQARLTGRRYDREAAFVKGARARFEQSAKVVAESLKAKAAAKEARAKKEDLPQGERDRLLAEAKVLTVQADTESDREAVQRYKNLRDRAVAENADFRESFSWLKERFEEEGTPSQQSSELLRTTLLRVRRGLKQLDNDLVPHITEALGHYLTQRVDVKESLRNLEEAPDDDPFRRALEMRRGELAELLPILRDLDFAYRERDGILRELLPFILNRIYWVRSDPSLGLETVELVGQEVVALAEHYAGEKTRAGLAEAGRRGSWPFALAAAGFLALVGLGIFLARRLAAFQRRFRYRGGLILVVVQRILATIILSALAPACLILAAQILGVLDLPAVYVAPGKTLLFGAAVVLFLRRFLWAMFREEGIAVADLRTPPDVADQLRKASRWITAGLAFLVLPWWILASEPLSLVTIPRLLYTAALAYYAVILILLIRAKAPLVSSITGGDGFWYRAWGFLGPILSLGFFVIVGMDVLGYRYGARLLTISVVQTFVAGLLIAGLYNILTGVVKQTMFRSAIRKPAGDKGEGSGAQALRMTRFVGTVTVAVTVYLLAHLWGVDETVRRFLDAVRFYTIDEEAKVYVTLFSVISALLWIFAAHFTVKSLPALYHVLIFSRLEEVELGTRFVFEAVTRYIILLFGYTSAILALHISFSSLGYIFAALSVGIGFGLQEIVSNFISGLILLLERPVRVGDTITVGTTSGTVQRISIRATLVLNWDREVIIIPNRKFITEEVVNWSHNDQVVRSSIDVGVAYGSDIEKVTRVLMEVARAHPRVLRQPEPKVLFLAFGESSLDFVVRIFTMITDKVTTKNDLTAAIYRRFSEEGIEIPFPQRDLHLRSIDDEDLRAALLAGRPGGVSPETKGEEKPESAEHPPED